MTVTKQIILASGSPRRQQFLRDLGLTFDILIADIDETPLPGESPIALVGRLACAKAAATANRVANQGGYIIIAADTIVALGDELLGKPTSAEEATSMLRRLRNRSHQVHSAMSILRTASDKEEMLQRTIINSTDVIMRDYSDAEIAAYVATGDPLDKAGAYAIQHAGFAPVRAIKGCYSGVMGLSLIDLRNMLAEFGVPVTKGIIAICERYGEFSCCQRRCFRAR